MNVWIITIEKTINIRKEIWFKFKTSNIVGNAFIIELLSCQIDDYWGNKSQNIRKSNVWQNENFQRVFGIPVEEKEKVLLEDVKKRFKLYKVLVISFLMISEHWKDIPPKYIYIYIGSTHCLYSLWSKDLDSNLVQEEQKIGI